MERLAIPSALPKIGVGASRSAPVIIATDGRAQSDAALTVGRLFAGGADSVRVVTVLKPVPVIPEAQLSVTADIDAARRAEARANALHQVARTWGEDGDVELLEGDPSHVISRVAHQSGAAMIVCGLGRHRVSDRVFGDETALRLIRTADVPVFAAATSASQAPSRIVVAVDFSETSVRAARLAIDLAASGAMIYLAHVAPRDGSSHDWKHWGAVYKQDAGEALQRVRDQLHLPREMVAQKVILQGDPATELLAFATSVNADLIATGSHGHGFVARMLIGSVTTRIVRCSTCSVLAVPHAAVARRARVTVEPPVVLSLAHAEWTMELDDFTRRNFGRRGTLEVDDPEIDAQAQEFDYPLLGAAYDVHDQRLELMFGDDKLAGRHLTRGIRGVTSIAILRDDKGRDLAMRIAHGAGLTLLTFTS